MLADAVILPHALASGSHDATLSLLMDLTQSGIVLIDQGGTARSALGGAFAGWRDPVKKNRAERLLKQLVTAGRLVEVPGGTVAVACREPACDALRGVAQRWRPALIVCGGLCCSEFAGVSPVDLDGFVGSTEEQRLRLVTKRFGEGKATEDLLRDDVFRPVIRFADWVKVFDRQIGRSLQDTPPGGRRAAIKEGFDRTVRAVLEASVLAARTDIPVTVMTGLWRDRDEREAMDVLLSWGRSLQRDFPTVRLSIDVRYEERRGPQLDHDRFLITNRAAIQVSRGFELVYSNRRMAERGFDLAHDGRRLHAVVLSMIAPPVEVILDAQAMDPVVA